MTASNVVPVSTRSPPITIGMWTRSADICCEPRLQLRALGRAGRVALDRLVDRGGRTEDAGGAHRGDCILDDVRVMRHPYDVPGWGVGEVWVRDGVIVQHELASKAARGRRAAIGPGRSRSSARAAHLRVPRWGSEAPSTNATARLVTPVPALCRICAGASPRICAVCRPSYDDVPLELDWATPLQHELAAGGARDSLGRGRLLRRARRARGPPGGGAGGGLVLRREPVLAHHPVPSGRRSERDRRLRLGGRGAEAAAPRARGRAPVSAGSLVDDVRAELAAIAPTTPLRPAGRDLGALPHGGCRASPRPRRRLVPPRPRIVRRRPASLRAPRRAARSGGDPHLHGAFVRSRDALPAPRRRLGGRARRARRGRRAGRRSSAARPAARPCRRPVVLPRRLPARGVSRRRFAHRPAVAAPRGANADAGRRVVPSQRRIGRGGPAAGRASATPTHAPTRRAGRRSRVTSSPQVSSTPCSALEERSVVAEMRAEANRLANADHANLVRTARAAQRQLDAARALRASGALESLPEPAARGGAPASAPSGNVAARAGRAREPADHEGEHAAAAGEGRRARRALKA